jgi:hypothetical protein
MIGNRTRDLPACSAVPQPNLKIMPALCSFEIEDCVMWFGGGYCLCDGIYSIQLQRGGFYGLETLTFSVMYYCYLPQTSQNIIYYKPVIRN